MIDLNTKSNESLESAISKNQAAFMTNPDAHREIRDKKYFGKSCLNKS
jgi:hypothetical protein